MDPSSSPQEQKKKPHAFLLPFPEMGHATPLSSLAFQLASKGFLLTILNTTTPSSSSQQHASLLPPPPLQTHLGIHIRLVDLPPYDPHHPPAQDLTSDSHLGNLFLHVHQLQKQQGVLKLLIQSLQPPVTCIISDTFFFWTNDLAQSLGIPRALFWTSSVTMLVHSSHLARKELLPEGRVLLHEDSQKEQDLIDVGRHTSFLRHPLISTFTEKQFRSIDDAQCIFVNSFEKLEDIPRKDPLFPIRVHPVGPLLPYLGDLQDISTSHRSKEEAACMRWLEAQATSSVTYVACGSVSVFRHLQQLAFGIEATKWPFLWAIREDPKEPSACLPQGFAERTKDRGLIVAWSPQLRVLSHRAVACFVTHCGWNSTMEGIFTGVPMLCYPQYGDQELNCELIVRKWAIGMELKRREDGWVGAGEVERSIRDLVEGEEGRWIRKRGEKLRDGAREALMEGGSSQTHLQAFVEEMMKPP